MLVELPVDSWPNIGQPSILDSTNNILLNSQCRLASNPDLLYGEFYLKRGKKNILVTIGESWSYGESLPVLHGINEPAVGTAINRFDFGAQLFYLYGSRMAQQLNTDWYQYAVPGNCNVNMIVELPRIIEFCVAQGYETIYLSFQLTESARDFSILNDSYCYHNKTLTPTCWVNSDNWAHTPLSSIYPPHPDSEKYKNTLIDLRDWLVMYYEILFDMYQAVLDKNSDADIRPIIWNNFCHYGSKKREYSFKFIEPTWIAYSARLLGREYTTPVVFNTAFFGELRKHYSNFFHIDKDWAIEQMIYMEDSLNFIQEHSNIYHNNHPSPAGHAVWAEYLLEQSGWLK